MIVASFEAPPQQLSVQVSPTILAAAARQHSRDGIACVGRGVTWAVP